MPWQPYVDGPFMCELEGTHLTSSAIIGHACSVRAQIANFPPVHFFSVQLSLDLLCVELPLFMHLKLVSFT